MDLNRLTLGDKIMGVSGILLFIFSFFKWLGYDYGPFSVSASAWSFTIAWLAVILGVLCVAYVVLKALDVKLPDLGSITWGQVVLGIAVLAFLLILIKLIAGPGTGGVNISGTVITKSRKIGIFLGLISSAGIVAGAYLNARDSGDLPGSLGGKQRGDTSPPPPTA